MSKYITNRESIALNHKENDFSIKFTALDYHNPEKNQYKYKLSGYDNEWRNTDSKNPIASYSNLPADTYTLMIKASNSHGVWNKDGKKISITIQAPAWKTWWAYTLYIIFSILILWVIYTARTKQLLQRALDLEEKVDEQTIRIRQQYNKLAEKNKDIEELIQVKDQLLSNVSHELKTPLTMIISPIKTIISKVQKEGKDTRELHVIQRNAYCLLEMVDQLIQLSQLKQANDTVGDNSHKEYIPLHKIINSLTPFIDIAGEKGIKFRINRNEPALIYCQQDSLEKIMKNLCANAIKYTQEGTIEISSQWHDAQNIKVKFKDTGIGIPENETGKIFDRLYRTSEVEKRYRNIQGEGIGLSLVKKLIEKLSGNIEVDSQLGEGSEFTVYLPAVKPDSSESKYEPVYLENVDSITINLAKLHTEINEELAPASENSIDTTTDDNDRKENTILIIDDNAEIRFYLNDTLQPKYHVLMAKDGSEGIKRAENEIPDIIISDVMMPQQDGFEVCKYLKRGLSTSHIPIILLTALHDRDSRLQGLKSYTNAYMTKPFDTDELLIQVENLLLERKRMTTILNLGITDETFAKVKLSEKDKMFLTDFKHLIIHQHSNSKFNVDGMALSLNVPRNTLTEKVKDLLAITPGAYLRNHRLIKAKALLKDTNLSIKDIARKCGFSSSERFSTAYREHFGISPTDDRKKHLETETPEDV